MRFLVLSATLLASVAAAQQPAPDPADVARLVRQLGSDDFAEREAAAKRLEELGAAAVEALRAGAKSDNAEAANRARDLLRKAERRVANEKTIAPTLVELAAADAPLDDVLADLSKQAQCEVILGGLRPEDFAGKKVTVATGGKVPFWEAVRAVCDAADLRVAGASGYVAPGALPYLSRVKGPVRTAADPNRAVALEPRDGAKPRPAAVCGAVLVEAVALPANASPGAATAVLQMWPEPRLQWVSTAAVRVHRAADAGGAALAGEHVSPGDARPAGDGPMVLVRNADGTGKFVRDPGGPFALPGAFRPNARQAVLRFRAGDKPAAGATAAFDASVFGTVRSPTLPLSRAAGLAANTAATGTGVQGVEMSVTYAAGGDGKLVASVDVGYDPNTVTPAGTGDELPGERATARGQWNQTVHGVRVTDADGKPYQLGLRGGSSQYDPRAQRVVQRLQLDLHPDKAGHGPPASVTFWGTHARPAELAVRLKDVPLAGGK